MKRYEVIVEIAWKGVTRFPIYLEAASEAEAKEMAQNPDYDDVRPADTDFLEIERVRVESAKEEK